MKVAILPTGQSAISSNNVQEVSEQPYAKSHLLSPKPMDGYIHSLYSRMSTKKIRGERYLDDDFSSLITTNPSRQWFWTLFVEPFTGNNTQCRVIVRMTFKVKFFKRKNVNAS